jgi:thiamine biosynthesis lipoprotein
MRPARGLLWPTVGVAALALLASCSRPPTQIVLSGPTMGTSWHLRAVSPASGPDAAAVGGILRSTLDEIDLAMSTYRPDSAISRFNASGSLEWFEVPQALADTVAESLRIGAVSGGAFDITLSPVVSLWGFGTGAPREQPPTDEEIAKALAQTGQGKLAAREHPPALRKALPGLRLDLDAIAPGYAVDLVAQRLQARGIDNYMIEIGGEVRVRGHNAQGEAWRIGIERPEEQGRSVARVLHLTDMAVSTSGDYRDFFESGGQRYSHTLDPRSGRPVTHSLASVTIMRPTAVEADGLATALSVLGPDEGFDLAESRGWAALFVQRTDQGFRQRETSAFTLATKAPESVP